MEYVGHAPGLRRAWCSAVTSTGREFVAFWLDGDSRVLAGMNVNVWDVLDDIKDLIRSRKPVDAGRLANPDVPLGELGG